MRNKTVGWVLLLSVASLPVAAQDAGLSTPLVKAAQHAAFLHAKALHCQFSQQAVLGSKARVRDLLMQRGMAAQQFESAYQAALNASQVHQKQRDPNGACQQLRQTDAQPADGRAAEFLAHMEPRKAAAMKGRTEGEQVGCGLPAKGGMAEFTQGVAEETRSRDPAGFDQAYRQEYQETVQAFERYRARHGQASKRCDGIVTQWLMIEVSKRMPSAGL